MLADDAHAEGPPRKRFRLSDLNSIGVNNEIIIASRPILSHLPRDVLLDILAFYPTIDKAHVSHPHFALNATGGSIDPALRARFRVLRSLSQVCRTLRATLMPLAWEHVEACIWDDPGVPKVQFLAYVLKRQCQGLLKSPVLASHVGTLSVSIVYCPANPTLKPLARCLAALPNLHTLYIAGSDYSEDNLKKEFKNKTFPTIKTCVLPAHCYPILACCFGVEKVHIIHNNLLTECVVTLAASCPFVRFLSGLEMLDTHEILLDIEEDSGAVPYLGRVKDLLALKSW